MADTQPTASSDQNDEKVAHNYRAQLISLVATKTGDRLASPKLILAWMLTSFGAPPLTVSLLVPIRESLALLPQIFIAAKLNRYAIRKWFWVTGSVIQGLSVGGFGVAVALLRGPILGWTVIALLTSFSLARGLCSVSSKDVMGRTIPQGQRGSLTGTAASIAGGATIVVGTILLLIRSGDTRPDQFIFAVLMAVAAGLWLAAAAFFARVQEAPVSANNINTDTKSKLGGLTLLWTDRNLRDFVITRTFLISTALMAPFLIMLANRYTDGSFKSLGILVIAQGLAALLSATFWGRLADRSSKLVLMITGVMAALLGALVFGYVRNDLPFDATVFFALVYFMLATIHAGVRVGRKTYLVDMATTQNRATYVALSNTIIGILLLAGSSVGLIAEKFGSEYAVLSLALCAGLGALYARRLENVQSQ
ncbi:MAG: MFS transporter [Gammaproteobacteria bacterium]|nr:MFS transporter [Gammaproteobacteria bacterium]